MRHIDLPLLAEQMGYVKDANESTQQSLKYRKGSEVIIMGLAQDGTWSYFNSQAAGDQGGVMQFTRCRLGKAEASWREVCDFLRPYLNGVDAAPHRPQQETSAPKTWEKDHTAARQAWMSAEPLTSTYLRERGIRAETLAVYAQDQIRQDWRGNVLFAHRDQFENVVGFEVKSKNWAGFAKGGQKALGVYGASEARQHAVRIVIVESGVDALSLAQIEGRRDTLYISTGGSVGQRTIAELKALIDRHPGIKVCLGFDNDAPGDLFAASVAEKLGHLTDRLRPNQKDWNDDLGKNSETRPSQANP